MSDRCPHLEAILADDARFERGYYASGRERADLIAAITALRQERDALRTTLEQTRRWSARWKEAARWHWVRSKRGEQ